MRLRLINDRYALSPHPRSGGMADVYRARDYDQEEKLVAVKIFKNEQIEADIIAESFKRETQALQQLKHPESWNFSILVRMKLPGIIFSSWNGWRKI